MNICYYDYKSEERFSRLKILCADEETLNSTMNNITPVLDKSAIKADIYQTTSGIGEYEVNIEFHDDYDKEAGGVFNEIIKDNKLVMVS